MTVSRWLAGATAIAMVLQTPLAHAAEPESSAGHSSAAATPAAAAGLRASAARAAIALAQQPVGSNDSRALFPRTVPMPDRSSKQVSGGGGKGMMVFGLVSSLAGVAATYYVVKQLQEQNKQTQTAGLR